MPAQPLTPTHQYPIWAGILFITHYFSSIHINCGKFIFLISAQNGFNKDIDSITRAGLEYKNSSKNKSKIIIPDLLAFQTNIMYYQP